MGLELWNEIEKLARKQNEVNGDFSLRMVDLGSFDPNKNTVYYRLVNNKINSTIEGSVIYNPNI